MSALEQAFLEASIARREAEQRAARQRLQRLIAGLVGVFDRMQLCTTNRPVEHGDELWFYYSGLKWRAHLYELWPDGSPRDPATLSEAERADRDDGWGAACLAVLRKDGFVSLDADEEGGAVLTKPLKLAGDRLFVNLEAPEGELRLEILDAAGEPLPGFAREDSAAVRGEAAIARTVMKVLICGRLN